MKASIFLYAFLVLVFVCADRVLHSELCYAPNTNHLKLCIAVPSNAILACQDSGNQSECNSRKVYDIKSFPDGAVTAPIGRVTEEQADCWASLDCHWEPVGNQPFCRPTGNWSAYVPQAKTVKLTSLPECGMDPN